MRKPLKFEIYKKDQLVCNVYRDVKPAFAFCSPEKDGVVKQLNHFYYCREGVIGAVPKLLEDK